MALPADLAAKLKRGPDGLFAAIAQERSTGIVLMMAWMDDEALERTLRTRRATYFSRSRGEYWVKGETSGHTQYVHDARIDCDGDTLLLTVDQVGAACHTGNHSCFDTPGLEFAEDVRLDEPGRADSARTADPTQADPAHDSDEGH